MDPLLCAHGPALCRLVAGGGRSSAGDDPVVGDASRRAHVGQLHVAVQREQHVVRLQRVKGLGLGLGLGIGLTLNPSTLSGCREEGRKEEGEGAKVPGEGVGVKG